MLSEKNKSDNALRLNCAAEYVIITENCVTDSVRLSRRKIVSKIRGVFYAKCFKYNFTSCK